MEPLSHRLDRGAWLVLASRTCSQCRAGAHPPHPRVWYLDDGPRRTYIGRSVAGNREQLSPLRESQAAAQHLLDADPVATALARAGTRAAAIATQNRQALLAEHLSLDDLVALSPATSAHLLGAPRVLVCLPTRGHDQKILNQLVLEITTGDELRSIGAGYLPRSRVPRSRECRMLLGRHLIDERLLVVSCPFSHDLVTALRNLDVQLVADRIRDERTSRRRERDREREPRAVVVTSPLVVSFGSGIDDVRIADAGEGTSLLLLRPELDASDSEQVPATVVRRMQTFTA